MEQIYFVLTERCNLSCSHCIRESSPQRNETAELDMMLRALNEIAALCPQVTVLLSGGEPTIYKYFLIILEYAISLKLNIIVNSNGATSFFSPHNLERLLRYEKLAFQISIDGVEEAHDLIRGKGMYRKSLRAINNLRALGINCTVSATVMNNDFFFNITKFIADLDGLGLRHIAIKRVTYAGRAASGSELNTATWNEYVKRVRQIETVTPVIINPMYDFSILDRIDDSTLSTISPNPSTINCGAGIAKFYVYPSGNVCSCTCFRELPIGNLSTGTLETIIQSYQPLQVKDTACNSCRYLELCKGGCLGSGYMYHGVLGKADPRCPRTENSPRTIKMAISR